MSVYYTLCFLAALAIFIAFANQYVVKIQTTIAITAGSMLISALMVLSFVAVPAIALLGGYSVWLAVTSTGGMAALQQVQPSNPIEFTTALTMVVGSFISAGTLTADFVRFGRKPWGAVMITMVAFFLGNTLMFVFGAAGAAVTGQADISEVMLMQGLLIPAILVLGLNIWTTNDNAL
ncbi:cytosine permease, partial [Aeromonas hydrophila]|uniref:cytosine permease n=1 Tax=Aeromonas hydrophila TaxID=644 RepID=UPI0038D109B0